ncbi:MAG: hypothetical protein E7262_00790 [Lachnospiraceae bacterium]|nr:hypothetical protein [Lachnospiraceae bacterium]
MKMNRKLCTVLSLCAALAVGTTAVVLSSTKTEVKACENETKGVVLTGDQVEFEDEQEESKRGLTDYFRRIKMKECTFNLEAEEFNWSGQVITPQVTVTYEGKTLQINKDYKIEYKDNIDAGEATIKLKGKGDYRGTAKIKFRIKGTDISTACNFELVDDKVVMTYQGEVVDASEYDEDWYYIDTFISDNAVEATYVRTTFYTITGKGRFEGTYELRSEKTYTVNNETGEVVFK